MNCSICAAHCPLNLYPIADSIEVNYYNPMRILLVQGCKDNSHYHLLNETCTECLEHKTIGRNLGEVVPTLPPHFQRVHESYIINAHYIRSYVKDGDVYLHFWNEPVPIGPTYKKPFLKWLKENRMLSIFGTKPADIGADMAHVGID